MQTSFASGELSPLLLGRTDLDQYYKGAQTAENVVIIPQGGVKRRPGTQFVESLVSALGRQSTVNPTMPAAVSGQEAVEGAKMNDGNDATYGETDVDVGLGGIVAQYDLGTFSSLYAQTFIDIRNIIAVYIGSAESGNLDQTFSARVEYSDDDATYTQLTTFKIDNRTARNFRYRLNTPGSVLTKRYWRVKVTIPTGVPYEDYVVRVGECGFKKEQAAPINGKTFDWEYGPDQNYLAVLTAGNLRFYRTPHAGSTDTVYVADVVVPYAGDKIQEVKDAQTEGVMLMFQEDYPPIRIIFDGLDNINSFAVDDIPFVNVPKYDYNDSVSPIPITAVQTLQSSDLATGQRYKITAQGVTSKDITHGGNGSGASLLGLARMATSAFNLQKNLQEMPVFGFTGITVTPVAGSDIDFIINMADESAGEYDLFTGFVTSGNAEDVIPMSITQKGQPRTEEVWSANRGYPRQGVFHEGRLWLGGTKSKKQSIFASRAGNFFDFFSEEGEDDEGIFVTIDSRNLTDIIDINPDRGLQVFCSGAEFLVKGSTPSTIEVVSQTQHGSANLEAQSVDGATLFVDRNGRTLRQFVFSFNEDAYTSADVSVLSSQLINNPTDMALLLGNSTEDANWAFIVNEDGTGAVLNTMRSQDINGFTRWTPFTDATTASEKNVIKSCSAVGDELYMVVYRQVNGSSDFYDIERWSFDHLLESGIKTTVTATGSDVVVEVGSRLLGYELSVLADGDVLAKRTAAVIGSIVGITITAAELSGFTTRNLEIGLGFTVKVKGMPLNTNPGTRGGQNTMKRKKITNINLRVYESAGIYIDGNAVPIRQFGDAQDTPLNTPFTPRTGIIEDKNGGNGWSTEVVPEITVPDGTPFHLQAIQYEVESS
jgi:hypothetical protein